MNTFENSLWKNVSWTDFDEKKDLVKIYNVIILVWCNVT